MHESRSTHGVDPDPIPIPNPIPIPTRLGLPDASLEIVI